MSVPDAVAAAKLWLISAGAADLPYLSEGLYALITVESDAVATVAADSSWRLYVNPAWVEGAAVPEVAREIAHQLWHLLLDHAGRAHAAGVDATTAQAWRAASDVSVCDALAAEGVVPPALRDEVLALRRAHPQFGVGRPTEEYWELSRTTALSPLDAEDGGTETGVGGSPEGSASDGLPRPWELPADAPGGVEPAASAVIRRGVALAYRAVAAERPGTTAGDLDRWAAHLAEPRIPWEHLLAQATRRGAGWTSGRTHTTYTRPNRRAASTPGFLLPGWRRQNPTVACIVDTSGSVDEVLLGRALGEVEGALLALGVGTSDLTVLACDAAVQSVTRLRRTPGAALAGGGGTDLRVALAAAELLRPRPTLAVVLTDGHTPWPDAPPPGCAVVVALLLHPGQEAPPVPGWATVIECRVDE